MVYPRHTMRPRATQLAPAVTTATRIMLAGGVFKLIAGAVLLLLGAVFSGPGGGGLVLTGLHGSFAASCLRLGALALTAALVDLVAAAHVRRRAPRGRALGLASGLLSLLVGVAGSVAIARFMGGAHGPVDVMLLGLFVAPYAIPVLGLNAVILSAIAKGIPPQPRTP